MPLPNNPYQSPSLPSEARASGRKLRIRAYQPLPNICALCGEKAVTKRRIEFAGEGSGDSGAELVLLPLCRQHRSFRQFYPVSQQFFVAMTVLSLIVFGVALIMRSPIAMVSTALMFVLGVSLSVWDERRAKKIRPTDITTKDIELIGLAPEFVVACEEMERLQAKEKRNAVRDFFSSHDGDSATSPSS